MNCFCLTDNLNCWKDLISMFTLNFLHFSICIALELRIMGLLKLFTKYCSLNFLNKKSTKFSLNVAYILCNAFLNISSVTFSNLTTLILIITGIMIRKSKYS